MISNILTFDVEEWFEVDGYKALAGSLEPASRLSIGLENILAILRTKNIKATFFVVGKSAERNPGIIKEISDQGHEVAAHGFAHKPISSQTPAEFEADLRLSIKTIQGITGKEVLGYRAPGYSVTQGTFWALDIIKKCGLKYDSSVYPVTFRLFTKGGVKGFPRGKFSIKEGLVEFPMATLNVFRTLFPAATTAYFRMLPYWVNKLAIEQLNKNKISAVLNFHSWEFDAKHPRYKFNFPTNIKHYYNLKGLPFRFERLLKDFNFTSIADQLR